MMGRRLTLLNAKVQEMLLAFGSIKDAPDQRSKNHHGYAALAMFRMFGVRNAGNAWPKVSTILTLGKYTIASLTKSQANICKREPLGLLILHTKASKALTMSAGLALLTIRNLENFAARSLIK